MHSTETCAPQQPAWWYRASSGSNGSVTMCVSDAKLTIGWATLIAQTNERKKGKKNATKKEPKQIRHNNIWIIHHKQAILWTTKNWAYNKNWHKLLVEERLSKWIRMATRRNKCQVLKYLIQGKFSSGEDYDLHVVGIWRNARAGAYWFASSALTGTSAPARETTPLHTHCRSLSHSLSLFPGARKQHRL